MKKIFFISMQLLLVFTLTLLGSSKGEHDKKNISRITLKSVIVENRGQWAEDIRFGVLHSQNTALFTEDGIIIIERGKKENLQFNDDVPGPSESFFRLRFPVPSNDMEIIPSEKTGELVNFYLGNDTTRWTEGAKAYNVVTYKNAFENTDVRYTLRNNKLYQEVIIHPGANPEDIRFNISPGFSVCTLGAVKTYQIIGEDTVSVEAKHVFSNCTASYKISGYNKKKPIYLISEFSTYFGGMGHDVSRRVRINNSGYIFLLGVTNSSDFPVLNAFQSNNGGEGDLFLTKMTCDGNSIVFSTYLGGVKSEWLIGFDVTKNSRVVVGGSTKSYNFPVTANAFQKDFLESENGFLTMLDKGGKLLFSTFIHSESSLLNEITRIGPIRVCLNGDILVGGITHRKINEFQYLKNEIPGMSTLRDTLRPNLFRGGFVLKFSGNLDSLLFGAPFGNTGGITAIHDIITDGNDDIIISGFTTDKKFPVVNEIQSIIKGTKDVFVTKLNKSMDKVMFSTFIGGREVVREEAYDIDIDMDNNVYVFGITGSPDFPMKMAYKSFIDDVNNPEKFIVKLSPEGVLLYSTYFYPTYLGGTENGAVFSCGDILIGGLGDVKKLPIKDSMIDILAYGMVNYYSVLDSSGQYIKRFTVFSKYGLFSNSTTIQDIEILGDYVYLVGGASESGELPVFNSNPKPYDSTDAFITKIYVPVCEYNYAACTFITVDSIRIEKKHGKITPESFEIRIRLTNKDIALPAEEAGAEIVLPPGLVFDPQNQSAYKRCTPYNLPPGASGEIVWRVRVDTASIIDSSLQVRVRSSYTNANLKAKCQQKDAWCEKTVRVRYYREIINVQCSLQAPDTLELNPAGTGYKENPFTVTAVIRNADQREAHLRYADLRLTGPVETVTPNDYRRNLGVLQKGDSLVVSWNVAARGSRWMKTASFTVVLLDTNIFDQGRCEAVVVIPPVRKEITCSTRGPDTIRYSWERKEYVPDPFNVLLSLRNHIDTMLVNLETEIDLGRAPHLELDSGQSIRKIIPAILADTTSTLGWRLHVTTSPVGTVHDTILMRYRSASQKEWKKCAWVVVIIKSNPDIKLACAIQAPDTLRFNAQGTGYEVNPLSVQYEVKNNGLAPVKISKAELRLSTSEYAQWTTDSLSRWVGALAPSGATTLTWRFDVPTSRYRRALAFRVVVLDSTGSEILSCNKTIEIEPVVDALTCSSTGQDSVRYDIPSRSYTPDPFTVSLRLANVLDTAQVAIEAEIDLANAPHLELAQGETKIKQLDSISARKADSVSWKLRVQSVTKQTIMETVILRYRLVGEKTWRACTWEIVIEEEAKYREVQCANAGPDSVWYNRTWETYIPNPFTVAYTLSNTGTLPLTACEAAILPPPELLLVDPGDSVHVFGAMMPGDSQTRLWKLKLQGPYTGTVISRIRWQWQCAETAPDTSCARVVTLSPRDQTRLVVTPRFLWFEAEKDGPLPGAKNIMVIPPTSDTLSWQIENGSAWLGYKPQQGDTLLLVTVQPTTTSLPLGVYEDTLRFTALAVFSPVNIRVWYLIYQTTGIEQWAQPGKIWLGQNYPNPVTGETGYRTTVPYMVSGNGDVRIVVYDALGREKLKVKKKKEKVGRGAVVLDLSGLEPGVYLYRLETAEGTKVSKMIVVD